MNLANTVIPTSVLMSAIRSHRALSWSVIVAYDLDGTGLASAPKVVESSPAPDLDEYVLAAVRSSKFKVGSFASSCVYTYEITSVRHSG